MSCGRRCVSTNCEGPARRKVFVLVARAMEDEAEREMKSGKPTVKSEYG